MERKNDVAKQPVKNIRNMSMSEIEKADTLGLDDTFQFTCKACGKCCRNRKDIVLTPYDVFRLARHLGRTPEEIINRYCSVYEGSNSHFPVVWLKPVPPDTRCPFLINKKCAVHAAKPVLCRTYPLARISGRTPEDTRFYFNGASCKHEPKPITVREWIADVASEESAQAAAVWMNALSCVLVPIQPDKLNCSKETREQILQEVFCHLWLFYDTKGEFASQLETNVSALRNRMLSVFNVVIPTMEELTLQMEGEPQ